MPTDKERDKIFDILDDFQTYGDYNDSYRKLAAAFRKSGTGIMRPRPPRFTTRDTMEGVKPKRKLSNWQKFVKANSKKKIYKYANGKLKLKKMGIAYRKKNK